MKIRIALMALTFMAVVAGGARAEIIQLKDRNSISAPVIKESVDHVYVDLGFDILKIPRTSIAGVGTSPPSGPQTPTRSIRGRRKK